MAFRHDRDEPHTLRTGGASAIPEPHHTDWHEPEKARRDWKKFFLVVGLGVLSWVATYVGMLELIEANMGDLPLVHKAIIAFSVAMLMTMIIWLLDQLFAPISLFTKTVYAVGYVFLTVISVGFGFGFYWKVLESRSESSRSAESAVTQVQSSLHAASTRLEQLSATLIQLTDVSGRQAEVERTKGASCPNSKPGDGPRRKLRDDDAQRFAFASEFVKGRVSTAKGDLSALDADLARIAASDASTFDAKSGTRNEFMKGLGRRLDMTVTGFNAFRTDPQLKQIRNDLAERAEKTTFPDTRGGTFSCPDPQLQAALRGVVRAIDGLPELEKPKIAAVEGSEATIEAFRRLTATFYGVLAFKLPPSAEELRELQKKAVQSVEASPAQQRQLASETVGLSKRDYIPLAVALFVDLCLLLVSMGRPVDRLNNLVPKMRRAERGPVHQILSRFSDIHRDPEIRQNFEIFRHVVFDHLGDYYVAIPLNAPFQVGQMKGPGGKPVHVSYGPRELAEAQLEAHLLANLFASFEKERIFSRVHSPFLSPSTVRKKLHRQGSKFANSEAFRIYKFKDGAWSDIILGAVMGAARRIEAEKKRRLIDATLHGATLDTASPVTAGSPATYGAHVRPTSAPSYAPVHPTAAVNPGWFAPAPDRGARGAAPGHAPAYAAPIASQGERERASAHHQAGIDPAHAAKYGPYARHMPPPQPLPAGRTEPAPHHEADVAIRAPANSNTAPAMRKAPAPEATGTVGENVIPLPRASTPHAPPARPTQSMAEPAVVELAPALGREETVDVTLTRETATFSFPVSEATLPQQLMRAGFARSAAAGLSTQPQSIGQDAAVTALPAAMPGESSKTMIVPAASEPTHQEVRALPDFSGMTGENQADQHSDDPEITAISRKFAYTPAE